MSSLKANRKHFLIVSLALIFCLSQSAPAQSGRKKDKPPEKPEQISTTETQDEKPTERIKALKIAGEFQYDSGWNYTTALGSVLDECVNNLQGRPGEPLKVEKVGKMKFNDAKALAKKETETYVLWMGFFIRNVPLGDSYVDFIDYAVLKPETGKILTKGRIQPGASSMGNTGTILKVPVNKKAPTRSSQLYQGAREVATLLKRGGWFD